MVDTLASIPSPPANGLHLGPLFVHAYGLMYAIAVVAAVALTRRLWASRGGDRALVEEVALWGVPAGLVGGRLYHDITSWNEVPHHWWGPLAIWKGGLGIWGGIALGTAAGLVVLHRRRADIPAFLDAAAPGLLVAQAIGRIGNYFNQELFGGPTSLPWGLHVDPAYRPLDYLDQATFHPVFLYESVWDVTVFMLLIVLWPRLWDRFKPGSVAATYLILYGLGRLLIEGFRIDDTPEIAGVRFNQIVSVFAIASGMLVLAMLDRRRAPR